MDPSKIESVVGWKSPGNVKQVQEFLGFANFYQRFIKNYTQKVQPLYDLLMKDVTWTCGPGQESAFVNLKTAFTSAPVLWQPRLDDPFIVECDSSDKATGAVLSQIYEDGKVHPIAFMSKALLAAERNYDIYDKELLAVIQV